MPCVITDGRFDDEDLYAHLGAPNFGAPDDDDYDDPKDDEDEDEEDE